MRRLQSRSSVPLSPLHALSIGELAAMSWLAESWTQRDAVRAFPGRMIAVDFEDLLSTPAEGIGRVLDHFELPHDVAQLSELSHSSVLARYSKAPEHAYTPEFRTQVLQDSRRQNRDEIRKGIQWLERQARSDNAIAEIVNGAVA
jgi:hypothetical protein